MKKVINVVKKAAKWYFEQRSRVKILLKGKYQRGTYLHLWRKLIVWLAKWPTAVGC